MFIRLLCLLSIFSFLSVSFVDAQEASYELLVAGESVVQEDVSTTLEVATLALPHCQDCSDDGCADSGNCCQSICTCTSPLSLNVKDEASYATSSCLTKLSWDFHNNYRSPSLYGALKPPLYS